MKYGELELRLHSSAFDTDNLRIHRLHARERMGRLFEVRVEIVALAQRVLDLDEVMGAEASVSIDAGDETARRFHGIVTRVAERPGIETDQAVYDVTLSPLFWQATLVETLDIHLEESVPEVLESTLQRFDLAPETDYLLNLTDSYPTREILVQYQETDLAFVSRLCEHVGIFSFFTHEEDRSALVFGDHVGAYLPIGDDDLVPYWPRGEKEGVFELRLERTLIPGTFVCRDYNDQTPALELQLDHQVKEGFAGGIIEYGGDFRTPDEGELLARVRAEEALSRLEVYAGRSVEPRFAPGHTFQLEDHPAHSRNLLLVDVEHEASQDVAGWGEGSEQHYENRFTAIPAERTYRLPRVTPIPRVAGVMNGVIETWQGQLERHAKLDEQGRYVVRFLFDTAAPGERKASCPVRMMQPSAGPDYGMHFPLKPGVEVLIGFVGGNPDRPVILGAVPNPITPTPVHAALSTKSRIKTRSGIIIEFEDADRG